MYIEDRQAPTLAEERGGKGVPEGMRMRLLFGNIRAPAVVLEHLPGRMASLEESLPGYAVRSSLRLRLGPWEQ